MVHRDADGVPCVVWREQAALVAQEPVLFGCSIRQNIIYGCRQSLPITDEAVTDAARTANAHEFISAFPDGCDVDCAM